MVYIFCLILFGFSTWMLVSGINGPIKAKQQRELNTRKKYGNAIAHHMVTSGITRRKAQKRVEMEILERENERCTFKAMVDCPKCGIFAIHWLERRAFNGVTRQCKDCGHEWRQE